MLKEITKIREKNNNHWMKLLEIALKSNPIETKKVLREIIQNDKKVIENVEKLIKKV